MNIFAAAVTETAKQPDYIALALVAIMLMVVVVMVIRKHLASKKSAHDPSSQDEAPAPTAPVELAPGSAGSLKLNDVSPKTAAILMAIVAHKLDKPLNELRFISVKEIEK